MVQGFIEIAWFPYGWLPSVDVDKHYDGSPSKIISGLEANKMLFNTHCFVYKQS